MTKYWMLTIAALGLMTAGCYANEIPPAESAAPETAEAESAPAAPSVEAKLPVAMVAFGDVDTALVDRAQQWASHNLAIPVPVLPAEPRLQLDTFAEVVEAAEKMIPENQIGLVVLWRPATTNVQNHGANFPEQRVAVANLNPMLTPDTDPEIIAARVERQAIRGICMAMGIEPSPNPMSAMFNYTTLQELDRIGRNLDLPWLVRVQEAAVAAGIEITKDSPNNVIQY